MDYGDSIFQFFCVFGKIFYQKFTLLVSQHEVQKWISGPQFNFCKKFQQGYRTIRHTEALKTAKKLALQLNVEPEFKVTRSIKQIG